MGSITPHEILTANNPVKIGANIIFLTCASFLNIAVLIEIPETTAGKAVFVALAIGLEIIAAYTLALASAKKSALLMVAYCGQVAFALVLHVLFGLSSVNVLERQNNAVMVNVARSMDSIKQNDRMIANLTAVIDAEKTNGIGYRYNQAFARIEKLKAENARLTITATATNGIKHQGVFARYGAVGEMLKFWIFILLSLLIQWALYLTKWTLPTTDQQTPQAVQPVGIVANIVQYRADIMRYIDAICREDSNALNGDGKASKMTGLKLEQCNEFRKMLGRVNYQKKALIETAQGGSRRNFTPDEMKRIIGGIK